MDISNHKNCVVRSVAWLTGKSTAEVIELLNGVCRDDGSPTLQGDGADGWSVGTALITAGWRARFPAIEFGPPGIPARALIMVPGHAFAIADGKIFDTAGGSYDGALIDGVYEPPPAGELAAKWRKALEDLK
jgi:hypothetical protein